MDGTATASRTSPRARRLTFARRVCVLVSLLLITPSFHGVAAAVLLVGPLVLAPAGYELSLLFACASVFLSVASWMTRRSGGDSAKGPVTDGKRAVRWLANGITVLALSASILVAGFECLLAVPYIAEPTGPAGDRVVVVERNVLLAGYGDVYLIPGGFCGQEDRRLQRRRWLQPHGQRDLRARVARVGAALHRIRYPRQSGCGVSRRLTPRRARRTRTAHGEPSALFTEPTPWVAPSCARFD